MTSFAFVKVIRRMKDSSEGNDVSVKRWHAKDTQNSGLPTESILKGTHLLTQASCWKKGQSRNKYVIEKYITSQESLTCTSEWLEAEAIRYVSILVRTQWIWRLTNRTQDCWDLFPYLLLQPCRTEIVLVMVTSAEIILIWSLKNNFSHL